MQPTLLAVNSFRPTSPLSTSQAESYYRARYYDPQAGKFLNEDPIRFRGGINKYRYVGNTPINRIDPTGLLSLGALKGLLSHVNCIRNCASDFANRYSLAGMLGIENPIGKAFLGNTLSGINDAANHLLEDPVALAEDLALGGIRQGVPGGGLASKGIVGAVTDGVVNGIGNAITGAGSETLTLNISAGSMSASSSLASEGASAGLNILDLSSTAAEVGEVGAEGLAGPVALIKFGVDAAIFGIGLANCW
jgi:RHS repeat-associated protein